MRYNSDTIVAISTAPGVGGIAIVRISGPDALRVFMGAFRGANRHTPLESHLFRYGHVISGDRPVDEAMGVFFKAPRSYTLEDVAEIHCHGGFMAATITLRACIALGARPALPGEFTYRAFVNGRVTLSQAEAVMHMISAQGEASVRAAMRQLEGHLPKFINECRASLTTMLAQIAAAADFPDEIDEQATSESLLSELHALIAKLDHTTDESAARVLREGLSVAIVGKPNVGKSSLLNAMLGAERAIVSDMPGTTRDVVSERLMIEGIPVRLSDTAGLREPSDALESRGVELAKREATQADIVLAVLDASAPLDSQDELLLQSLNARCFVLLNKIDMPMTLSVQEIQRLTGKNEDDIILLSARAGMGLDRLIESLKSLVRRLTPDNALLTNERHIARALAARTHLGAASELIINGLPLDLAAVDLTEASATLGEISGITAADEVIDAVFEQFCVGK